MSDLGRRALLGSLTTALGSLGGFAGRFVINALLARILAPEHFGQFALALVQAEFLAMIGAFSFPQTLLQLEDDHPHVVGTVLWLSLGLATLLVLAALVAWPLVAGAHGEVIGLCFLAMAGSRLAVAVAETLVAAQQRRYAYHAAAAIQFAGAIAGSLGALALAMATPGPFALVIRDAGPSLVVALALGAAFVARDRRTLFTFDRGTARAVWRLSTALFWNRVFEIAYLRVDQLVIGAALGERELGFYQQARYLAGLPQAAVAPIAGVVGLRTMSALRDDPRRQGRVFGLTQFAITRLLLLFGLGSAVAGDLAVHLILGPGWAPTGHLLSLFAPWLVLLPLAQNYKVMLIAVRRFPPILWATGLAAAMMAASALPLAAWLGSDGLALANTVVVLAHGAIMVAATPPHLVVDRGTYLPTTLAALGGVAIGLGVRAALASAVSGWWPAAFGLAAAFVAFAALSWALEGRRLRAEAAYLRAMVRRRGAPPAQTDPPE